MSPPHPLMSGGRARSRRRRERRPSREGPEDGGGGRGGEDRRPRTPSEVTFRDGTVHQINLNGNQCTMGSLLGTLHVALESLLWVVLISKSG